MVRKIFNLRRLIFIVISVMIFAGLYQYERSYDLYNTSKVHHKIKEVLHFYIDQKDSNKPNQEQQPKDYWENKLPLYAHQNLETSISDVQEVDRGNEQVNQQTSQNDTKIILYYIKPRYINPAPNLKKLNNCPYRCSYTTNKDYHAASSALLFSAALVSGEPPKRFDKQVFVLHNHEPQCTFSKKHAMFKDNWKSTFNWTMWYREDSDIHEPYGLIVKKTKVPEKNFTKIYFKKTKMAAAMVSNCHGQSKRMQYIRKLMTLGVDIDVFGGCGHHSCKRGEDDKCRDEIHTNYKFFLSFENSFCPDYISEKFFVPFRGDIIIVARGGGNYSKEAPQGTFINTQDFKNIKDVAEYIIRLSTNKDEYIDILNRKNKYESLYEPYPHINNRGKPFYYTYHYEEQPMCDLCRRLWNVKKYHKSYSNIKIWFDKRKCLPVNDLV